MNKKTTVAFLATFFCLALGLTVYAVTDNGGGIGQYKHCVSGSVASGTCVLKSSTTPVVNAACMKAATEKRDNAIIAEFSKFDNGITAALQTRKTELVKAWDITDVAKRRAAIYVADKNYRKAAMKLRYELNAARKYAWKVFNQERKKCNGKDDMTTESSDSNI